MGHTDGAGPELECSGHRPVCLFPNLYYSYYFAWQLSVWIRTGYEADLYFSSFVRENMHSGYIYIEKEALISEGFPVTLLCL